MRSKHARSRDTHGVRFLDDPSSVRTAIRFCRRHVSVSLLLPPSPQEAVSVCSFLHAIDGNTIVPTNLNVFMSIEYGRCLAEIMCDIYVGVNTNFEEDACVASMSLEMLTWV
jgi:hypothetical protein